MCTSRWRVRVHHSAADKWNMMSYVCLAQTRRVE